MMKKEEEVEKLEEEVVMLRVKVVKLNKNVEEKETSTSSVEENPSRFPERKNEEKPKTYAEVIKGSMKKEECNPLKKNIPEVQKTQEEDYRRRSSTFKPQRSLNHDHDQPRKEFRRTTPQRRSFTPRYVNLFYGHCFYCTNFGHKVADCRAYGRNVQERNAYVAPHNIECYKCHNYGHIARNCRSMIVPSMKKETYIRYTKIWKRKEQEKEKVKEEQVNKDQVPEIAGFAVVPERKEERNSRDCTFRNCSARSIHRRKEEVKSSER
jgi:hypothetical protein